MVDLIAEFYLNSFNSMLNAHLKQIVGMPNS